jgi:multidrug efflux pump subunit AcrA (membrane-fusion protein)
MRRRTWVANGVLVVLLGGVVAFAATNVGTAASATTTTEQTSTASKADVTASVSASGNLSAATQVGANFTGTGGTVTAIYVQVGDRVAKGQPLAKIDDTSAKQTLASAKASLASAKAQYATTTQGQTSAERARDEASIASAEVSVANAKESVQQAKDTYALDKRQQDALVSAAQDSYDSATDATRSQAKTNLDNAKRTRDSTLLRDQQSIDSAQGQVTSAKASLASQRASARVNSQGPTSGSVKSAQAQMSLDETVLRAPVSGTVSSIAGVVGESSSVGGGTSTSTSSTTSSGFLVISSLDALQVVSKVAEADASKVALGQPATITFSAAGKSAQGTVTAIDVQDTVTNNVVEYGVTVTLDTPDHSLKLGQTASVSITTGSRKNVLSVPSSAITKIGGLSTVTVRKDGADKVANVTVGLEGNDRTEIVSGVNAGDVVVLPSNSGLPSGFTFPTGGLGGLGGGVGS